MTLAKDFTTGSVPRHLFGYSFSLFLTGLLQLAYSTVDMFIVGRVMGEVGLSAVSVGGDVVTMLMFFGRGFASAGRVLIAKYLGAGQKDRVGRLVATMVVVLLLAGLVLGGGCFLLRHQILRWMNTPAEAFQQALNYSGICILGLVFSCGYNALSAVMGGMGDARHPVVFVSIAAVTNVILDILLVAVFPLGAAGAAIATVISQCLSFVACALFLYRRREDLGFVVRKQDFLDLDREELEALCRLGIPMAIKSAAIHFSKLFVNSYINSYGVVISAFAGVAGKIKSISNEFAHCLSTAGASIVGQNIGARKYQRVTRTSLTAGAWALAVAAVCTALVCMFPEKIFGFFMKPEDMAAMLPIARAYLPVAVLVFLGSALRAPANALLNGSGNYRVNFVTAILDGIVLRIGLALLLGKALEMGYMGFWLGDALAGFVPAVIGLAFYFSGRWKNDVLKKEKREL